MCILYWIIKHVLKWNTNWLLSINKFMARCFKIYYHVILFCHISWINVCTITDCAAYCDLKYQMMITITIWFLSSRFPIRCPMLENSGKLGHFLHFFWDDWDKKFPKYPELTHVTMEHKSSHCYRYICSNSQKYIMGQNYTFFFYAKNH